MNRKIRFTGQNYLYLCEYVNKKEKILYLSIESEQGVKVREGWIGLCRLGYLPRPNERYGAVDVVLDLLHTILESVC